MFSIKNHKVATYFTLLLALSVLVVGCKNDVLDSDIILEDGALAIAITRSDISSSETESTFDNTLLKIYNDNDRLIASYEESEIPDAIYLAAGNYKATVTIDPGVEMSTSIDDLKYYGESEFTIVGGQVSDLKINCAIQSVIVAVVIDESVYERFEKTVESYLTLTDAFSMDDVTNEVVPAITFTEDGIGYFVMPEGVNNISWGFYGESDYVDPVADNPTTTVELSGVIEAPAIATQYTLRFNYSQIPDGSMSLTVVVDTSVDEFDDLLSFSPQPTIDGIDFDISSESLLFTGSGYQFSINSISDISDIVISSDDLESDVVVMESGVLCDAAGVSYSATSTKVGVLTLSTELFSQFNSAGSKIITISVTDVSNSRGFEYLTIGVSGVEDISFDLWNSSAIFSANVLIEDANSVQIAYKSVTESESEWRYVDAVKGDGNTYTALAEPTWSQSTNDGGFTIYNISGGIAANNNYDYRLVVDGVEHGSNTTYTADGHTIPNGDMESSSIPAFSTSGSSSTTWASGNNFFSSDLCDQVTLGGSNCAYLKSKTASNVFAAGNMFFGQFEFNISSLSGTVGFGQAHTWVSRPRTFKFRYAATIGAETHDDDNRLDGYDKARVYFAIVDWSGRHDVTSSSSGNPTGAWDPTTQSSTDEGKIIGYASLFITESTSTSDLIEVEIPIHYYDYVTKPSGSITMVVSCAASAYGDYMTGSTSSRLWVDDFELGY